jgi:chemotaxis response regulator CheB
MTSKSCAAPGTLVTTMLRRKQADDRDYDVVALAASTGGMKALVHVLGGFPLDFPVPVLVAQHRSPD